MIETLVVLALAGCVADAAEAVCRFSAPPGLPARHVRLELPCLAPVYLNGSSLEGGARVRAVSELLNGRGPNTLRMPPACAPARLLLTPHVYIATIRPEGKALSVTVENTLDNTVSIGLSCRGSGSPATASATIPARGLADLSILLFPQGRVTCLMEKTPEALEESYTFQMDAIYQ